MIESPGTLDYRRTLSGYKLLASGPAAATKALTTEPNTVAWNQWIGGLLEPRCPSAAVFQQHMDDFLYLLAKSAYLVIPDATNALRVQLLLNVPVGQIADKAKALKV
jgi:hypothetical protein